MHSNPTYFGSILKVLFAFLAVCLSAGCASKSEPEIQVLCTTADAESITESSAVLNGTATIQNGSGENVQSYFYYSADEPSDAEAIKTSGARVSAGKLADKGGSFSYTLKGLKQSSTYYYVASVTAGGKEATGKVKSFTTSALAITGEVTGLSETKASLHGLANLSPEMAQKAEFGIEWSATDLTREATTVKATERDANGSFVIAITGLKPDTKYYYRAFVLYNGSREYGEVKSFTTIDSSVSLTTEAATDISNTRATLNGTLVVSSVDELSKEVYFKYGKSKETLEAEGTRVSASLEGDRFSYAITGLTANTTYFYAAYSVVEGKETSGEVKSFSTADFTVSVTTLEATDISSVKANLKGRITVESVDELSKEVYFKYGTSKETLEAEGTRVGASLEGNSFSHTVICLTANTTYYFVACSEVEGKVTSGEVKSFTTKDFQTVGVVDLGLSVKWAACNVGAGKPEEAGDYFAWGETEPKASYTKDNYKWYDSNGKLTKYCPNPEYGTVDNKTILDPEDDAATVNLGSTWRTPTRAEWQELIDNCEWTWTTYNGMNGYNVASRKKGYEGVSIFLPAAGSYRGTLEYFGKRGIWWSSNCSKDGDAFIYGGYNDLDIRGHGFTTRYWAHSVRPVTE